MIFVDSNMIDVSEYEDTEVLTVEAFGQIFKFRYPNNLDPIDVIGVDHDGEVFVASCGQRPVYDSGAWYMGDEGVMAGKMEIEESEAPQLMSYIEEYKTHVYAEKAMPDDFTPTLS